MSERARIQEGLASLKVDLLAEQGPQISTMRNYRFAIFQYLPDAEFELRAQIRGLIDDLQGRGWGVLSIDLHQLLLDRVMTLGSDNVRTVVERERRTFAKDPIRALDYLREKVCPLIEGPEGIAADVVKIINQLADRYPNQADRTLVLIGRAGALYPFFRSSALLRHLDGQTRNIPVVLLYPGTRVTNAGLSFMGVVPPDRDYRPRIYPLLLQGPSPCRSENSLSPISSGIFRRSFTFTSRPPRSSPTRSRSTSSPGAIPREIHGLSASPEASTRR